MIRKIFRALVCATALSLAGTLGIATSAQGAVGTLPIPGDTSGAIYGSYLDATGNLRDAILLDGIPIAFKYDDFWSYSAHVLDALQSSGMFLPSATFGTYDFAVGTGTLDVIVFTGSGGASNQNSGPSGTLDFEDPAPTPSGNTLSGTGTWGNAVQPNGPVTVGQMLDLLQEFDPSATIPVFFVDWAQSGAGDSILASARAEIRSADGTTVLHTWALDNITQAGDGTYDAGFPGQIYNYGDIDFLGDAGDCAADPWNPITGEGCAGVPTSGNDYTNLNHNQGSGKADFIIFSPTMDLSQFDPSYRFVIHFDIGCGYGTFPAGTPPVTTGPDQYRVGCLSGAFEEAFISGAIAAQQVPEPAPLGLLGIAAAALWLASRRKTPLARA